MRVFSWRHSNLQAAVLFGLGYRYGTAWDGAAFAFRSHSVAIRREQSVSSKVQGGGSGRYYTDGRRGTIVLFASPNNSTLNSNGNGNFFPEDFAEVEEPGLLFLDYAVLALSCELMGLVDVLGDAEFWKAGGFFQPIPIIPATLGTLVSRYSVLGLCWLAGAITFGGYQTKSVFRSTKSFYRISARMILTFVALRLVLEYLLEANVDILETVRQLSVSIPLLVLGRVLARKRRVF